MEVTPVIEADRFTEEVTTEPVIVSLTSVTGVDAISKDVNKDASISDKFGRKDSPNAVCKLMIIRFRLGFLCMAQPLRSGAGMSWRPFTRIGRAKRVGRHGLQVPDAHCFKGLITCL